MKISSTPQNYINQAYSKTTSGAQTAKKGSRKEETLAEDSINLSSTTRDLQKISAASENEPAERTKQVQALKQQVQTNQYTVNAEEVAEKMIGSIMDELG
jgi:negative regulator of flagellin synthesis FlgM